MPEANRTAQQQIYQLKIFSNISHPQIKQAIQRDQVRTGACFTCKISSDQGRPHLKSQAKVLSGEWREAIISGAFDSCSFLQRRELLDVPENFIKSQFHLLSSKKDHSKLELQWRVEGAWWSPRSSKPLGGGQAVSGVFDSHPLRHYSPESFQYPFTIPLLSACQSFCSVPICKILPMVFWF